MPNTTFEQVFEIYCFDSELRGLLNIYLARIEISAKTKIAYSLANNHSPLSYKDSSLFVNINRFNDLAQVIDKDIQNQSQNESFIQHYGEEIPIWVAVEVFSFGLISRIFSSLNKPVQNEITKLFLLKRSVITSDLHALTTIRNICAHRGRLYDRHISIYPSLSSKTRQLLTNKEYNYVGNNGKLFVSICAMIELLNSKDEANEFIDRLNSLVSRYINYLNLDCLGFPVCWKEILLEINKNNQ